MTILITSFLPKSQGSITFILISFGLYTNYIGNTHPNFYHKEKGSHNIRSINVYVTFRRLEHQIDL